jgi:hypothetical protein
MAATESITISDAAEGTVAAARGVDHIIGTAYGTHRQPEPKFRVQKDSPSKEKSGEKDRSPMPIDALYPASEALSPDLGTALRLLAESIQRADEAVAAADSGERLAADNALIRVQALMPELFCCRSLGDGFGHIISAVYYGIKNRQGSFLDTVQVRALRRTLDAIRSKPFMLFDEADKFVDHLEEANLDTEPSTFKEIQELVDEEGIR